MYKRQKGIMFITTLLISSLILIFFMSIISITNQSQRNLKAAIENEKAMLAARAAYQEALFDMHKEIAEQLDGKSKDPKGFISGSKEWTSLNHITLSGKGFQETPIMPEGSPDLQYGYSYSCKAPYTIVNIVAAGRLKTDRGMVVKHIISSEITEYMGIIARHIGSDYGLVFSDSLSSSPPSTSRTYYPKSEIQALLSSEIRIPLKPWIGAADVTNIEHEDKTGGTANTAEELYSYINAPGAHLEYTNPSSYIINPLQTETLTSYSFMNFDVVLKFLRLLKLNDSLRKINPNSSDKYRDVADLPGASIDTSWKKVTAYQITHLLIPETDSSIPPKTTYRHDYCYGPPESTKRYPWFSDLFLQNDLDRMDGAPYELKPGIINNFECFSDYIPDVPTKPKSEDNTITGNNFWLIPLGYNQGSMAAETLDQIDGLDKYRVPDTTGFTFGTESKPDLVLKNAFIIVTGNLHIKGNIRGNGILIVFGNLTFCPNSLASNADTLIIYASGRIFARGGYSNSPTDKNILTQMPPYFAVRLKEFVKGTGELANFADWEMSDFGKAVKDYYIAYVNQQDRNKWNENYWNKELDNWYKANSSFFSKF